MTDLRTALCRLESAGRIRHIKTSVSPIHELASVSRFTQLDPVMANDVLIFENVEGSALKTLANLFHKRENVALSMGMELNELLPRGVEAIDRPIDPEPVQEAPCQEVVLRGEDIDLEKLGICQNSEQDGGRFITAGVHITRNPATGVRNVGIQRNHVHARDMLGIWMAPTHMRAHYEAAEARGESLPVAIVIGVHPAVLIASQFRTGFDQDEMRFAGGFLREPIPMVRCVSSDLEVPADAEIVIEGEVLAG